MTQPTLKVSSLSNISTVAQTLLDQKILTILFKLKAPYLGKKQDKRTY